MPLRVRPRSSGLPEGVGGSLATAVVSQLVLIASGILVARMLGVHGRGQLAILVLVPSVLGHLGTLGLPLALTFHVARDPDGGRALLRRLIAPIAAQLTVVTLAQLALLWLLLTSDERAAMAVSLPVSAAVVIQQYGLAVLQGTRRFPAFNALRVAPAAGYAAALILLAALGATSLVEVVGAWTAVNVAVALALAVTAARFATAETSDAEPEPLRRVLRFGLTSVVGSSSPAEVLRVDQAIIAVSLSRAALGLYVVALAFTNLPRFISQSLGMVAYPNVATAARARDVAAILRRYLLLVLVFAGGVVLALELALGRLLPWFFGQEFEGAVTTARIVLLAAFLLAVRRVLTDVAQGCGHPGAGTAAELVGLGVALPLVAVGAPAFGIEGAAVALVAGAAGSLAFLAVVLRSLLGRRAAAERLQLGLAGTVAR